MNGYGCTDPPSNARPPVEAAGGIDTTQLYKWAYAKYNEKETAVIAAEKMRRELRAEQLLDNFSKALLDKGGDAAVFAGNVPSLLGDAADVLVDSCKAAMWTYVVAYSKGLEPTFRTGLFEATQGAMELALHALSQTLKEVSKSTPDSLRVDDAALQLRLRLINGKDMLSGFKIRLCKVCGIRFAAAQLLPSCSSP